MNRLPQSAIACSFVAGMSWLGPVDVPAATFDVSGYTAGEVRLFFESPAFEGQKDEAQASYVLEPEFRYHTGDRAHQVRVIPFLRLDTMDDNRTHFDIREGYWRYTWGDGRMLVGVNNVFWGVAESRHLVDIINQVDGVEDVDEEDKLGQPMLSLGTQRRWGDLELFLMPYFRERTFPSPTGRPRTALPVSDDALYESGSEQTHLDTAIRYAHHVGDWDIGGYYFYGTSREPVLVPNETLDRLTPFYTLIHQVGSDIQYTRGAWLWKFEGIAREGHGNPFGAMVGGCEHTLYQVWNTRTDLGLLLEYNYDGRDLDRAPPTLFHDDLFLGTRLVLNDVQTTEALLGALFDLDSSATFVSLEARRRFGDAWTLAMDGRFFVHADEHRFAASFERDSFINLSVRRYF